MNKEYPNGQKTYEFIGNKLVYYFKRGWHRGPGMIFASTCPD
jgi:hypothetical protein